MSSTSPLLLVINCGSSSLKFALYAVAHRQPWLVGIAERLGSPEAAIRFDIGNERRCDPLAGADHAAALFALLSELATHGWLDNVRAVGHRVVHGGERFTASALITPEVVTGIEACAPLAPLHNPANLIGIRATIEGLPSIPQVAVFDTAFHQTMPPAAYLYALPRRYQRELGVRRYGFHGTSHRYVAGATVKLLGLDPQDHGLVIAHLGNGASATAVHNGASVDTTMGLTPLEGLVMGTRSGDVDFGALCYIARHAGLDLAGLDSMVNQESGLLGLSELSNDCRALEAAAAEGHPGARDAIDVFVHRLAGNIGRLAMSLPRLDAVVFTGGIGENSATIRAGAIDRLAPLGLYLDAKANASLRGGMGGIISLSPQPAAIVVPTDEEWMIASDTIALALPSERAANP
jgi:acetate kinase